MALTELLGFATGAASVWLAVRRNVLTWPVGIANNLVFAVLFFQVRLFADMSLQFVYVALSLSGWWYWLHGGEGRRERPVGRVSLREAVLVGCIVALGTAAAARYLETIGGAAPFFDALTACMSLGAVYLMGRKFVECWWVWISVDVIYIPLYVSRGLPITAVLYAVFLLMCVRGLIEWRRALPPPAPALQASTA